MTDGDVMLTTIMVAKCGREPRTFIHGHQIEWFLDDGGNDDPDDDVLFNSFDEEYTRSS